MKKLVKINLFTYSLAFGLLCTQVGCSSSDRQQASSESEEAYNDFKDYVTTVESQTRNTADTAQADWKKSSAAARATYNEKVSRLDQYNNAYDEDRQQEIANLKTRYNNYWEQFRPNYQANQVIVGNTRSGGLAADYNIAGLSTLAATNMRMAFEDFVRKLQANKQNYTREDWLTINTYYEALDARREAVEDQLTAKDKYEIGKAKTKYAAIKGSSVAAPYVKEAASDVKEATKTGTHKVGNAAEKIGSEVKSTTKKVVDKVDPKIDKDQN